MTGIKDPVHKRISVLRHCLIIRERLFGFDQINDLVLISRLKSSARKF